MECEVCVRKLLCVWSPYTGLLGENEKEEKKKGIEGDKEKEGEGCGDDAVTLDGDLKNGNTDCI